MVYCLYLRKSRADAEAEARGEGETLARHEKTLLELAKKKKLPITQIYREIVSGETIASRPVMQRLLSEVEAGIWQGVLVMEVERLARGDTIDQGIVSQAFKYSHTKIITPLKTYDPNNEFDEEYFEFGLFMSRREYKTINRRLQQGRSASVKEGKYVGNIAPYGYKREKLEHNKGYTLIAEESEADIVRLIYELYTEGEKQEDGSYKRMGASLIARRLNDMKIPTKKGGYWTQNTILGILDNPVYCGLICWNRRKTVKKIEDGKTIISRPRAKEYITSKGIHQGIISEEVYNKAQSLLHDKQRIPINKDKQIKNPLSGLVICGKCGRKMVRRPYGERNKKDTLMCPEPYCKNVSAELETVEKQILVACKEWLKNYEIKIGNEEGKKERGNNISQIIKKSITKQQKELEVLKRQMNKTYDLLEQEVYDMETFLERTKYLSEQIEKSEQIIAEYEKELSKEQQRNELTKKIIPRMEKVINIYETLPNAEAKNEMLKSVLEKVVYEKDNRRKKNQTNDTFTITIYPAIPSNIDR